VEGGGREREREERWKENERVFRTERLTKITRTERKSIEKTEPA